MASSEARRKQLSYVPHQPCPEGLFVLKGLIISHLGEDCDHGTLCHQHTEEQISLLSNGFMQDLNTLRAVLFRAMERHHVHITSAMDKEFVFNQNCTHSAPELSAVVLLNVLMNFGISPYLEKSSNCGRIEPLSSVSGCLGPNH